MNKHINKEIARKMINPYYFADRALQVGFSINLDSHHINHINSKTIIKPNFPEFGIELRYVNKVLEDMATIFGGLVNPYRFRYQTVFSARFDKQDDGQMLDEIEFFINLTINQFSTESDIGNINIKSPLEFKNKK